MKTPFKIFSAVAGCALLLSSCVSPYPGPRETSGGVLGAVGGAIAGGIIGNQSGRGLEGAAIGGTLGALAGSAIGNSQDEYYYEDGYRYSRPYRPAYYSSTYIYDVPPPRHYYRPYRGYHSGYYNRGYHSGYYNRGYRY